MAKINLEIHNDVKYKKFKENKFLNVTKAIELLVYAHADLPVGKAHKLIKTLNEKY